MNLCYIQKKFDHLDLLKKWIKSNINILAIKCVEDLKNEDFLIISRDYDDYDQLNKKSSNILIWENIYEKYYNYSISKYTSNYDFYRLKSSLKKAIKPQIETIVVGSSYALFGIEESILSTPSVNLSLASQDMYYASLIGRHVINQNNNIKRIFIGTGYYSFYNDLSLTQGGEIMRVANIYYPIFSDKHNCKELPRTTNEISFEDEIFEIEKIVETICDDISDNLNGDYFTDTRDRFRLRMVYRGSWDSKWSELNDIWQEESAYERAKSHNKAIVYVDSYKENIEILNSFVSFCNKRKVKVYIMAFPSTRFYKKYLLKDYKESYMSALNLINGEIQFIDFNDLDIFDDKDFVDMDHLDKGGAIKLSEYINTLNL